MNMNMIKTLIATAVVFAGLALVPAVKAQVVVNLGIQPSCQYGYYDYAPYACAPMGFYGSGYFYNGIFLGMGPWAGWGYGHGWGGHRFSGDGGGSYHGDGGRAANRGHYGGGHASPAAHNGSARPNAGHAEPRATSHAAPHAESHAAPASHAGGGHEGGGEHK
jgi:hypothetical protein